MSLDQAAPALPVLDFAAFRAGGSARSDFLTLLRAAARDPGFFYLIGHGIEPAAFARIFAAARAFFALPEADKLSVQMVKSPQFRGYNRAGAELTRGQPDWREQLDIGAERPAAPLAPDSPPWARLRGPNLWPAALPDLKPAVLDWQGRLNDLAIELLEAFALALGQTHDAFARIYARERNALVKLIRYPGRDATDSDQGVGAHKDSGFLTLLAQDQVAGLEVQTDQGWVRAHPIPDSFVVNVGEILELSSNGYLRATVHRVVTPPPGVDRLSVAHFFGADLDGEAPLLSLPPALAAEATGPASDPANPLFRDLGRNYLKGRLRSHPDVAQAHHADLLAAGYATTVS